MSVHNHLKANDWNMPQLFVTSSAFLRVVKDKREGNNESKEEKSYEGQ